MDTSAGGGPGAQRAVAGAEGGAARGAVCTVNTSMLGVLHTERFRLLIVVINFDWTGLLSKQRTNRYPSINR